MRRLTARSPPLNSIATNDKQTNSRVPWLERLYLEEECAVGFDLERCEAHGFRFSGPPVPGAPALDAAAAAAAGTPAGLSVIGGGGGGAAAAAAAGHPPHPHHHLYPGGGGTALGDGGGGAPAHPPHHPHHAHHNQQQQQQEAPAPAGGGAGAADGDGDGPPHGQQLPPAAAAAPHPRRTPGPPHARATGHVRLDGMGPKLLVSDRSTADQPVLRWRLAVRGNTAVEVGVVPLVMQAMPKALHKCWQSADMRAVQVQQQAQAAQAQAAQGEGPSSAAGAGGNGNNAAAADGNGNGNGAAGAAAELAAAAAEATAAAGAGGADGGATAAAGGGSALPALVAARGGGGANDAAAAAPAPPPRAEAVGFSSGITVGSQLPVRVPIMKGSVVEVLAWRDARRVEFSVQNPPDGHELAWQGGRTVTRPYRGPRDLRLSMDFPDGSGDVKLALTCWAYGAFDVVHTPAKEAPVSLARLEAMRLKGGIAERGAAAAAAAAAGGSGGKASGARRRQSIAAADASDSSGGARASKARRLVYASTAPAPAPAPAPVPSAGEDAAVAAAANAAAALA